MDAVFYFLCAAYALVSSIALIQLVRIEVRVPEYGWTTQKIFHLMNFIVNGVRAVVFGLHKLVFLLHPKARGLPTDKLKIVYISVNAALYLIQVCIWIYLWINDNSVVEFIGESFIAGWVLQVGSVTTICFTCFLIRCIMGFLSAFDSDASLDVLDHPILDLIYFMLVEVLPSALVLYILRKLPPKRISAQYHPIR
ncbi:hypothetical protein JHK82_019879 [Glycine max]|nr:hypothetical protein JHK85_020330 [Glycine max]KAG5039060.1 hypothetical protein JHK86_019900 [Glycine max]KAG5144184.1 hypothetical protein JHK82_019879 [Glycine max]